MKLRIALVGLGKVARDQHRPAIARSERFELVAGVSPVGDAGGVPVFPDVATLLASGVSIDALALCQPPQFRFDAAAAALTAGKHVLLEKPPGATALEVEVLTASASLRGRTLFCAWHSRHAPGVEPARAWLAGRCVREVSISWQEDVRQWHPGQQWIWEPGGMGVFDPGINALSIATRILDGPLRVCGGTLDFPANRNAPIAARLALATRDGVAVQVHFNWLKTGTPEWDILVRTDDGDLRLTEGGVQLEIAGQPVDVGPEREYSSLYERFAELIDSGRSDADTVPLRIVADAFLRCSRQRVEAFEEKENPWAA
ncbi:MAG: Gfo/Idh/MocA family oxidoreductase [Pseudomonadota bacterium]